MARELAARAQGDAANLDDALVRSAIRSLYEHAKSADDLHTRETERGR